MKNNKLTTIQKVLVFVSGIFLITVLFVPLWRIDLVAPQYPEGLTLIMYPNKLAGNVEIINGLNHYIGMKTLHTSDFIEFRILPYIIGFFALFCFVTLLVNRKKLLTALFISFAAFGVIAMIDFYRWEYNYGHNLDPSAPIQVPGMSYTPPLIGYKELLNFEAYSMAHVGGFLFFGTGFILLVASFLPYFKKKKMAVKSKSMTVAAAALLIFISGCNSGPTPIRLGQDGCDFCKMSIADNQFGAEILTKKGKVYKFDDTHCLSAFRSEKIDTNDISEIYFVNYIDPHNFIPSGKVLLLKSPDLHSPMGGNTAAFDNEGDLKLTQKKVNGEILSVQQMFNSEK